MEAVHALVIIMHPTAETTQLHAEDRGDDPHMPPVDHDQKEYVYGTSFMSNRS